MLWISDYNEENTFGKILIALKMCWGEAIL